MCNTCFSTASHFDAAPELPCSAITIRILATVVQWIELSPPKGVIQVRFLSGAPVIILIRKMQSHFESRKMVSLL